MKLTEILWHTKKFEELEQTELYKIMKLRQDVFILEQSCFYADLDNKDIQSLHIFATRKDEKNLLAYARVLPKGLSYEEVSIGRVVTHPNYRHLKLGRNLMMKCIEAVSHHYGTQSIRISAQAYLKEFYMNIGFKPTSEIYLEDNIPHIEMLYMDAS